MGRLLCRAVLWIYSISYLLALFVFAVGIFGWFGANPDPLSGVYLVLIGQPWIYLVDVFPETAWPIAAALTPAINLMILMVLCRIVRTRQSPG
ncbi:MAG: hypothetical protein AAGC96_17750 [Pseudomonadota bacterium]